jgi:asparagine synthase (glutamine-hydrolysing)
MPRPGTDAAHRNDPARAIFAAWRSSGPKVLDQLIGAFALAIVDAPASRVLLAVDRVGIERLTYAVRGTTIVFGTSAEAVARHPSVAAGIREQALFDYLLLHMVPAPDTVYTGVSKLQAATCALFENGRVTVERYWTPRFVESGSRPFQPLKERLQSSLRAAVAACEPDERTGAFLSGGIDSSSVAGMLAKVRNAPVHTFSIGFGVDEYNELQYARIANKHFGTVGHEYDVTAEDIVTAFPTIARAFDEPFGNSSAVPTYFCAKFAAGHGFTHLLAGDGGDEIFGGNERYVRQKVFELYQALPGGVRQGILEPLTRQIDPESRITPLRKLRSYVDQARIPMPERLESWNFMYRTDLAQMLDPQFQAAIDTRAPLRTMAALYEAAPASSLLHKMLFYDWQFTLSDNDLRKVGTMCGAAGVKVSYPMLDPAVLDLSIEVPPHQKISGHELRSFYKKAMSDFLPGEIIRKTKHGFGLPFGVWLKTHARLADLIYSYLSSLKSRRIVRAAFLDKLIEEARTGHPGYYGYAIWDLAMLEAWLQAHAASVSLERPNAKVG